VTTAHRRRGIAPLEFVFVFPLLLMLTAALFLIARADLSKSFSATDSRHRAWRDRPSVQPGPALTIDADIAPSLAKRTTLTPVEPGPLFPGGLQAESRSTLFAHSWDNRAVPYGPGHPAFEPHLTELGMIAGQVPLLGLIVNGTLAITAWGLDPSRNWALITCSSIGWGLNFAVVAAGYLLHLTAVPAINSAKYLIELAMIPLRLAGIFSSGARRLLRYLRSVVNMMNVGNTAAENLYEASQGRPGSWHSSLPGMILGFRP
jgi:hypothetical protein